MSKAFRGWLIFTGIEIATLVGWLILAGVPFQGNYSAVIVLAVGLAAEHYASINVGAGRPIFGKLPPDHP